MTNKMVQQLAWKDQKDVAKAKSSEIFEFIAKIDKKDGDLGCGFIFKRKGTDEVYSAPADFIEDTVWEYPYCGEFVEETIKWSALPIKMTDEEKIAFTVMLDKHYNKDIATG